MKRFLLILCLAFSGCASVTSDPATAAGFLRAGTTVAAYEGLKHNPRYVPGAAAMVAGIDVALTGNAVISDATIVAFVQGIAAKNHMEPAETLFLTTIARTAFQAFSAKYHVSEVLVSNPDAKLYLQAFRDGLNDAVISLSSTATHV